MLGSTLVTAVYVCQYVVMTQVCFLMFPPETQQKKVQQSSVLIPILHNMHITNKSSLSTLIILSNLASNILNTETGELTAGNIVITLKAVLPLHRRGNCLQIIFIKGLELPVKQDTTVLMF